MVARRAHPRGLGPLRGRPGGAALAAAGAADPVRGFRRLAAATPAGGGPGRGARLLEGAPDGRAAAARPDLCRRARGRPALAGALRPIERARPPGGGLSVHDAAGGFLRPPLPLYL